MVSSRSTQHQERRTRSQHDARVLGPVLGQAPLILSVGRLVEKKGFPDLIAACARLKQAGRRFAARSMAKGRCTTSWRRRSSELDWRDCVTLAGERGQAELIPIFQRADIFALAPFVTEDGDRDGIPNVLVEAMACGLPVVSTAVAGIPELVRTAKTA